jgi:hypothetical protein
MSAVESPTKEAADSPLRKESWADRLRREPSARAAAFVLLGVAALSSAVRIPLVGLAHAPTVFSDELSYSKLALSIGKTGQLALFNHRGLSYSPLYPLVLSPIYALGASAPTAYTLIKVVNVLLMSLAIFPTYKIARFVLPRRPSLLVAGLSAVLPVLAYSSFVMSENLGYTACLFSVWAMLAALRDPGPRADAILVLSIAVATLARIQLVVLIPVALTAFVLAAALDGSISSSPRRAARDHALLFGVVALGLLAVGVAALSGRGVFSLGGSYAAVGTRGIPNIPHFFKLLVEHAAGLEFAVGVVPFVGTLVAAYVFARMGGRQPYVPFAAVALSLTVWLLLETAFQAAQFDSGPGANVPRIHERFFVYVAPLFLIGVVAAWRSSARQDHARVYLFAAGVAVVFSVLIPYGTVINNTVAVDSFGLQLFTRVHRGRLDSFPHPALVAAWVTGTLALLYYYVRTRLRSILILVVAPFLFIWVLETDRIESSSSFARGLLPAHTNWVDRARPLGDVALITTRPPTPELQTAFANLSIDRVYYVCRLAFGTEFGEEQVKIGGSGLLRTPELVKAQYVVAPSSLGIRGRTIASNPPGKEVLVAPLGRTVGVQRSIRAGRLCG